MGLVLTGILNAPYPDDPSEMDIVTWCQVLSAMRTAAAKIDTLQAALAPFATHAPEVVTSSGWATDDRPNESLQNTFTAEQFQAAAEALEIKIET